MAYSYQDYINRTLENTVNKKSLYYSYDFPYDEVLKYVKDIIKIPIEEIVVNIKNDSEESEITPRDVVQFSDLDDATIRLCDLLKEIDNPGVTYIDAGKLLLNDGKARKDGAYTKYGENHLKTSDILGLTFELTHTYFLSAIGTVVDRLTEDEREQLIVRLILRGKLVRKLIKAADNEVVDVRDMLNMLSDSTYVRRRSNMKALFSVLEECIEYDFTEITKQFVW